MKDNLRHVLGCGVDERTLDDTARRVFLHAGQAYYDFFRAVGQRPEALLKKVEVPRALLELVNAGTACGRGVLVLATHMSNFDLAGLWLGARGLSAQVLSLAEPGPGFRMLNDLRGTHALEITPITPESLRAAVHRLAGGGVVITGADRPMLGEQELVEFFGVPAELPLGPARLALMADASVIVASCYHHPDGIYRVEATGPIEMVRTGQRRHDTLVNARRLARVLEEHVSAHPDQWLMFHRVWPEPLRCSGDPGSQPGPEAMHL